MWTLPKPDTEDSGDLLKRALSRDRGVPPYDLKDHEVSVALQRYAEYDARGGLAHPELLATGHSEGLAVAIHNAYSQVQEGARLEAFRERLLLSARLCPYCSSPAITDLDHYLPRSKYRDFSIYGANLVPSCHPCNNVKRAFAPEDDTELHLVHPYFDTFPDEPIVEVDTALSENGGLAPVLYVPEDTVGQHAELRARARFQIERFDLNERLGEAINLFLSTLDTALEDMHALGGAGKVSEYLTRTAIKTAARLGKNDWHARLLSSLAQNEPFCDGGFKLALGRLDFGDGLA